MQITITREYHFDKLSARFPFLEYLPEELRRHSGRIFNRDDRKTEDYLWAKADMASPLPSML